MSVSVDLTYEVLSTEEAVRFVTKDEAGGIALFAGTTRRFTEDRETALLRYEAYDDMAVKVMRQIAAEAYQKWTLSGVWIRHRLNEVPVGQISVVIAVSSPHRREAFAGSRYLIDELKQRVPIWKKEVFSDGSEEWVDPTRSIGMKKEDAS